MKIFAIILSAGSSHRMGSPKALLKIGGKTFLQHIIESVDGEEIHHTIVVLGFGAEEIQKALSGFNGTFVVNNEWSKGQLTSIIAGVRAAEQLNSDAVIICPVDHPKISSKLIKEIINAFYFSEKNIIIPAYQGKRGHPVLIAKKLFPKIYAAPLEIGLRSVVHTNKNDLFEVPTDEEGILLNIDTQEEYQKYIIHRG